MRKPKEMRSKLSSFKKELPTYMNNDLLINSINKFNDKIKTDITRNGFIYSHLYDYIYKYDNHHNFKGIYYALQYKLISTFENYGIINPHNYMNIIINHHPELLMYWDGVQIGFIPIYLINLYTDKTPNFIYNESNKGSLYNKISIDDSYQFMYNDNLYLDNDDKYSLDLLTSIKIMDDYMKEIYKLHNLKIKDIVDGNKIEYYKLIYAKYDVVPEELMKYQYEPFYTIKFKWNIPITVDKKNINDKITCKRIFDYFYILFFPFLGECMIIGYRAGISPTSYLKCIENININAFVSNYRPYSNFYTLIKELVNKYMNYILDYAPYIIDNSYNGLYNIKYDGDYKILYCDPSYIMMGNLFDNNILRLQDSSKNKYTIYYLNMFGDPKNNGNPIFIDKISDIPYFKESFINDNKDNGIELMKDIKRKARCEINQYKYALAEKLKYSKDYINKHEEIRLWIINKINNEFNNKLKYKVKYETFRIFIQSCQTDNITISLNLPKSHFGNNLKQYLRSDNIDNKDELFAIIKIFSDKTKTKKSIMINSSYINDTFNENNNDNIGDYIKSDNFYLYNYNLSVYEVDEKNFQNCVTVDKKVLITLMNNYLKFLYENIINNDTFIDYLQEIYDIFTQIINSKDMLEYKENIEKYKNQYNDINIGIGEELMGEQSNQISINDYDNISQYFIEASFYINNFNIITKKLNIREEDL